MLQNVQIETSGTLRMPEPHRRPTPPAPATRPGDYVELTVHFRCNLECQHCMILESMHWLEPADEAAFWRKFGRNGFHQCAYRAVCGSQQCLGINTAYAARYGWHEDILAPLPVADAAPARVWSERGS